MTLRVLIADNDPSIEHQLRAQIEELGVAEDVCAVRDGQALRSSILAFRPDAVLLDVAMAGPSSFEIAAALPPAAVPAVIFMASEQRHALKAFERGATDYLLKPFSSARLASALARVRPVSRTEITEPAFWVDTDDGVAVAARDIDWVAAERDHVRLHTGDRSHLLAVSIAVLAIQLRPAGFLRIHPSTLVRQDRIAGLARHVSGGLVVRLSTGHHLRVSRRYVDQLRALVFGERVERGRAEGVDAKLLAQLLS